MFVRNVTSPKWTIFVCQVVILEASLLELRKAEVRRPSLPRTPANSLPLEVLRQDRYHGYLGDGSHPPLPSGVQTVAENRPHGRSDGSLYRTVVKRGEERSLLTAEESKGENPMKLARLDFTQHPRPPNATSARESSSTLEAASSVTWRTSTQKTRGPFGSWRSLRAGLWA